MLRNLQAKDLLIFVGPLPDCILSSRHSPRWNLYFKSLPRSSVRVEVTDTHEQDSWQSTNAFFGLGPNFALGTNQNKTCGHRPPSATICVATYCALGPSIIILGPSKPKRKLGSFAIHGVFR